MILLGDHCDVVVGLLRQWLRRHLNILVRFVAVSDLSYEANLVDALRLSADAQNEVDDDNGQDDDSNYAYNDSNHRSRVIIILTVTVFLV